VAFLLNKGLTWHAGTVIEWVWNSWNWPL